MSGFIAGDDAANTAYSSPHTSLKPDQNRGSIYGFHH